MSRWNQPRPFDWRVPSSPSSFCVCVIRDREFSPEPMIFLVYNHPDEARRSGSNDGKPAGYGMPGGGLNPEWLENQEQAAKREGGNESGLMIKNVRLIPVPGKKNKLLILDKKTGKLNRTVLYEDGKQESVKIAPSEKAVPNPFNIYLAAVDWINSRSREFFLNFKKELVAESGCTEELIARLGLSTNGLTREELLRFGVDEEEVDEIGGFALLPINLLRGMHNNKWFFLDQDEDPDMYFKNNKVGPTSYVYQSHVERILKGLDIMGVA